MNKLGNIWLCLWVSKGLNRYLLPSSVSFNVFIKSYDRRDLAIKVPFVALEASKVFWQLHSDVILWLICIKGCLGSIATLVRALGCFVSLLYRRGYLLSLLSLHLSIDRSGIFLVIVPLDWGELYCHTLFRSEFPSLSENRLFPMSGGLCPIEVLLEISPYNLLLIDNGRS